MNLHENKELFADAFVAASQSEEDGGLGIKRVFLEKDYWITRSLKLLSESPCFTEAVFKGGTSLSKAYGLGYRFSEDVDIAVVSNPQRTDSQTKTLVSNIYPQCKAYLQSQTFKEDFNRLLTEDQERFKEPIGWQNKHLSDSPLLTQFSDVWKELEIVYEEELPELAYKTIPTADEVCESITQVLGLFL